MKYSELQNGSDIRGIALDNENHDPINLTAQAVRDLAAAFTIWLKKKENLEHPRIAGGRDSRLTGPVLLQAALDGCTYEGAECVCFELASTPAMFMFTVLGDQPADGSIMITASHLPYYRNGMKFFTRNGGLEHDEITELVEIAESLSVPDETHSYDSQDFMEIYSSSLCKRIKDGVQASDYEHPLAGLHVLVDAGNGGGGFFANRVLKPLGADISGSQFLDPDGHFPNHIPNPEDKAAAASVKDATLQSKADLGIIFDTDVDRAGAVLPDGRTLTRNDLIAVLSVIALKEHPGTTIVTDSVTSTGLADFIEAHGGVHHRFKRGYRNVIDESIRLNNSGTDSQLAIETSGHGAFKENYFLDDGAYLMVKLLIEMGKGNSLTNMIKDLREPAESFELRFHIQDSDIISVGTSALNCVTESVNSVDGWSLAPNNFEGVRINCDVSHGNGWYLLRRSLHEPILPLNLESDSVGGCKIMAKALYSNLKQIAGVDWSPLEEFIQ